MESTPICWKRSRYWGIMYSAVSTRAIVFRAPSVCASMQQVMLRVSSGVTAMKRSHWWTPPSLSPLMEVGDTLSVMMSRSLELRRREVFSGLSSMRMMSWSSLERSAARCEPTAPAPAMTIFIGVRSLWFLRRARRGGRVPGAFRVRRSGRGGRVGPPGGACRGRPCIQGRLIPARRGRRRLRR